MKVAAIQTSNDINITTNADTLVHLLSKAKNMGAELVAFPECALTGFSAKIQEIPTESIWTGLRKIQDASVRLNIGVLIPTAVPDNTGLVNGAFFFSPDHNLEIHKTGLTDSEKLFFKDGSSLERIFKFQEHSIGVFFCREIHDDSIFSNVSNADLILWPGYWGWDKPFQWSEDHKIATRLKKLGKPVIQINFGTHPEHKLPPNTQQGCSIVSNSKGTLYMRANERIDDILIVDTENLLKENNGPSHYIISKFESLDLHRLKPLLDESAGYSVSLEDELEYFKSIEPINWFYLCEDNKPIGYIRCFPQGSWGTVELFMGPKDCPSRIVIAKILIEVFMAHTSFDKGFRLRFELPLSDLKLTELIKEFGFKDRVETFLYYEKSLSNFFLSGAQKGAPEDLPQIKSALENLHEVSEEEVLEWIQCDNIYVHRLETNIASAAQVYTYGESAEINRIATNPSFLRRGSAMALLNSVHSDLNSKGIRKISLKVDELKKPARALYEKVGYQRVHSKDQVWLSKIY